MTDAIVSADYRWRPKAATRFARGGLVDHAYTDHAGVVATSLCER
jgi:hypothetical protein